MIAVVTGGTSFVGAALLKRLLDTGAECYAIVRPESRRLAMLPEGGQRLHVVRSALGDTDAWASKITKCDVFYHFAWDGVGAEGRADAQIQSRNVAMAVSCMRAAAGLGAGRFLFAGSQAEYGLRDGPITEDTPCDPVIEYGRGKLRVLHEAERLSAALGMEYVHMRIFSVYGENDHPWTLVSQCLRSFLNDQALPLSSCEQMWNFLHVEDAARAMEMLARCDLRGERVFNLASDVNLPLRRFVDEMWQLCGRRGRPAYGERPGGIEKVHGIEPVIDRLLGVIDWRPEKSFEAGIREIIEHCGG